MNIIKQEEFDELMDSHELWLCTDSKKGEQLFLRDAQLHNIKIKNRRLDYADFSRVNFQSSDIEGTSFSHSRIVSTELYNAELKNVNFEQSTIKQFKFYFSFMNNCKFYGTDIYNSDFEMGNIQDTSFENSELLDDRFVGFGLHNIEFRNARIGGLSFLGILLTKPNNLESVNHQSGSYFDVNSLIECSGLLPQVFLRGIGINEKIIEYLPSLSGDAIQFYSCFISYSKDQVFADRIHNDLQNKGIRCWLYTENIKIGDKFRDKIYEAIRLHDKLLVVISQNSENSEWVEEEVLEALEEEKIQNREILFPIMIDDTALTSKKPWIQKIKLNRHIGDFRSWHKDPEKYIKAFERLTKDLTIIF